MLVPWYATVGLSVFSAAFGFVVAMALRKMMPESTTTTIQNAQLDVTEIGGTDPVELAKRIVTLHELTTHVGAQVNQHSQRVTEITDSMESPTQVESTLVLAAGKLLLAANEKLKSDLEEAKKEIELQRDQMAAAMQEARTDPLTNLPNRRALEYEMIRVAAQHRRSSAPFSLLVLDIDHFKRFNDQFGHMVGDQLLKCVSRRLSGLFKETEFVARYGGEEFVAVLPKTTLEEACKAAERVGQESVRTPYKVGELDLAVSFSIGVREVASGETEKDVFQKADRALFAAKNGGRNCCYYHDGATCRRYVPVDSSSLREHEQLVSQAD